MSDQVELQKVVGQVAAAYLNNNHVAPTDIAAVISNIAASISAVGAAPVAEASPQEPEATKLTPAQIRRSIGHDKLISFEDGKGYKTLRRHLAVKGLSPDDYRRKWGLPMDYPMVAPGYSQARSSLAKAAGFGSRPAGGASAPPAQAAALAAPRPARPTDARKAAPRAKRLEKVAARTRAPRRGSQRKAEPPSEPMT